MTVSVIASALDDLKDYFEALPEIANEAAFLAVNDSARDTLPAARRAMTSQINFPSGYLSTERLGISKKATRNTLEAVISGRDRPTSLARFARGATPENSRGRPLSVEVKSGQRTRLRRAFLVRLRNGNIGLAVRLPPGQTLQNSEKAVRLDNNVYLLYGPSVDQVFRGVAEDLAPDISANVSRNFLRQFARLSTRG
jgi:hypothetical protein